MGEVIKHIDNAGLAKYYVFMGVDKIFLFIKKLLRFLGVLGMAFTQMMIILCVFSSKFSSLKVYKYIIC